MCDCKTTHDVAPKTGKKIFVTVKRGKAKDAEGDDIRRDFPKGARVRYTKTGEWGKVDRVNASGQVEVILENGVRAEYHPSNLKLT